LALGARPGLDTVYNTGFTYGRWFDAGAAMRAYMERLKARGELLEVEREVDPKHELAAVTAAAHKRWGKPILFHKVKGTALPVLTNIYGSRERLAEILGIGPLEFCRKWSALAQIAGTRDVALRAGARRDDLVDCSVGDLPLITYSERDGGAYFTSAMFLAREPETGVRNLSFHRSMYVSDRELRCRLAPRHHLTLYHEKAEKMGRPLEAAMLIGPPPTAFLTAAAPLAYDEDELEVAAKLAGEPIDMRPCKHIDLMVPASTEIVIEGRFLPNVRRDEGPFGEFMGYYTPVGQNAVFEVLGVTRKPDAIFHSILCGSSEEVLTLELSVAAKIYERISAVLPGIVDVTCQPFVLHTVVKIRQHYEGHGRQVLLAVFGAEPTWAKICTVVDEDVDIYDMDDVMWATLTRSRPDRNVMIIPDTPSFYRDPHKDHWGRMGIDATVPFDRRADFERKRIPGADTVDLSAYFGSSPQGGRR
jgi:UbiD family decarboxylase